MALQPTEMACLGRPEQAVIVGGKGGDDFSFTSASYATIKRFTVTYSAATLNSVQVIFNCGHMIKVGNSTGNSNREIVFEDYCKIISIKLWPNSVGNRCAGVEFVVADTHGVIKTFSVKCQQLGVPVSLDLKSGKIHGVAGRSGDEIDALGFIFV